MTKLLCGSLSTSGQCHTGHEALPLDLRKFGCRDFRNRPIPLNSRAKLQLAGYLLWPPMPQEAAGLVEDMNAIAVAITYVHLACNTVLFANVQAFHSLRHLQYSFMRRPAGDDAMLDALHHLPALTKLTLCWTHYITCQH